jgi:DNA-binding MarR family transcriptional regulator
MQRASPAARVIARDCIGFRVRLLGRVVTGLYDDALRPHGVRVSQLTILVATGWRGQIRPTDLAEALEMDKSTVSRDIKRLIKQGWLEQVPGSDGRSHYLRLTDAGEALLEKITPAWREAQNKVTALLGEQSVHAISRAVDGLRAELGVVE